MNAVEAGRFTCTQPDAVKLNVACGGDLAKRDSAPKCAMMGLLTDQMQRNCTRPFMKNVCVRRRTSLAQSG